MEQKKSSKTGGSHKKPVGKKSKRHKKGSSKQQYAETDSDSDGEWRGGNGENERAYLMLMLTSTDLKPLHVVNTVVELPEGAIMSDTEDKATDDLDDPHRALDIDLDVWVFNTNWLGIFPIKTPNSPNRPVETERPVRDSRKTTAAASNLLISRSSDVPTGSKSTKHNLTNAEPEEGDQQSSQRHHKKGKKKNKEKDHTRERRNHEKDEYQVVGATTKERVSKSSSHSSSGSRTVVESQVNLLVEEGEPVKKKSHKKKHSQQSTNGEQKDPSEQSIGSEKTAHKKSKKSKKEKSSKKSEKNSMSGYEEALGISTPSKEII